MDVRFWPTLHSNPYVLTGMLQRLQHLAVLGLNTPPTLTLFLTMDPHGSGTPMPSPACFDACSTLLCLVLTPHSHKHTLIITLDPHGSGTPMPSPACFNACRTLLCLVLTPHSHGHTLIITMDPHGSGTPMPSPACFKCLQHFAVLGLDTPLPWAHSYHHNGPSRIRNPYALTGMLQMLAALCCAWS